MLLKKCEAIVLHDKADSNPVHNALLDQKSDERSVSSDLPFVGSNVTDLHSLVYP